MNSRKQEVVGAARKYAESYSLSASQKEQQDEAKSDNVLSSSCLDSAHESGLDNGRDCMASDLDSADESGLDNGGDGMASGDGVSKRRRGRPADVQVHDKSFLARCNDVPTPSNQVLMEEFGCSYRRVQYLKKKFGCGQTKTDMNARHTDLLHKITFDSLQTRWVCEEEVGVVLHRMPVAAAVKALAVELGVSVKSLRQRMRDVEFDPLQIYSLAEMETMVRTILETHSSGQLGATFVEAKLRLPPFNRVVRMSLIRKALKALGSRRLYY